MINSVKLENFRGFRDTTVPLSKVTLLTGTNGVGKTTVLEGLYCLFSETRLDVSPLVRYNRTLGLRFNQFNGGASILSRTGYNYKLFWEECTMFSGQTCKVTSKSEDGATWQWTYSKARMSDLDEKKLRDAQVMGIAIDSATDIASFKWQFDRIAFDKAHRKTVENNNENAVQVLSPDGMWYMIPLPRYVSSVCRYMDFASIRAMPQALSYNTAKKLTEALRIIDPRITDIRISKIENGLSIILNDEKETTLGTIGNGAVTWASSLISIFELFEQFKIDQQTNIPVFVLIDEFGAGLHYSVMNSIWDYIKSFAIEYPNIQFVLTSHSDDCARAFCETFLNENDVASIVRLHKAANNDIVPTRYDASRFKAIMLGEWEVRG